MCTAITYRTKDHYFGRNLDLEYSYQETVTITPRNYPFTFRRMGDMPSHYAIIGMAYVQDNYPLYYDGTNEKGLSIAGLNFPGNADYKEEAADKDNVTPFELIPWILGQCENVAQARELLNRINLVNIAYSSQLPLSPLHWIISDRECSVTVESVKEGLKIYDNPVGVLTNNPTFDYHMFNLINYKGLSVKDSANSFAKDVELKTYCCGLGALGLPGDFSSLSRFVKAAFVKTHSLSGESELESVSQFFHILNAVAMPRGSVILENGASDITVYSSCCNTDKGIYYYTTYDNSQIVGVDMYRENLDGTKLASYPLLKGKLLMQQDL